VASDVLGLTSPTWVDPITTSNYCAPLNVLVFNSAVNTYEHDSQMSGASDLGTTGKTCNAATWTNTVGTQENINGQSWFVGNDGSGSTPADLCSSKTVSNFADVYGLCPEGAGTEGGYQMAGVAYFARTNRIRNPSTFGVPTADTRSLKVSTYGIALATNTPKRTLTVNGTKVTIMPQGRLDNLGYGSGSLVDWKIVCEIPVGADAATVSAIRKISAGRCDAAGSGAFYWNHEDSEQGGDYDQDMWGRVQYLISGNTVAVTTDVISQSTPYKFGFGYAISGTTKDGPHFHSGINGFSYSDSNAATVTGDTSGLS
jgi:type IV pilus assembly protein PilY1